MTWSDSEDPRGRMHQPHGSLHMIVVPEKRLCKEGSAEVVYPAKAKVIKTSVKEIVVKFEDGELQIEYPDLLGDPVISKARAWSVILNSEVFIENHQVS
jgi:hypothetical protein